MTTKGKKIYKKGDIIYVFNAGVHCLIEVEDLIWSAHWNNDKKLFDFEGWVVEPRRILQSVKKRGGYMLPIPLGDKHRMATEEERQTFNNFYNGNKTKEA